MKPKTIHLADGERIIAVVPEHCAGPGWANQLVVVYIATGHGTFREEYIQPEERTPAMHAMFSSGAAITTALMNAVPVKTDAESRRKRNEDK